MRIVPIYLRSTTMRTAMLLLVVLVVGVSAKANAQPATLSILHSFDYLSVPNDGGNPYGSLIQGTDGDFYGMTGDGQLGGQVFKITSSGQETILYSFDNRSGSNDGLWPDGSLVQGTDGNFYGMTDSGGSAFHGTVFKITPSGQEIILHSFGDGSVTNEGYLPFGSLVQGIDGNFYGMTLFGGFADGNGAGTMFKITPSGQTTKLHTFGDGVAYDGGWPYGNLIQSTDGNFYGMTYLGGTANSGTVFKITPSGQETILHSFGDGSVINDGSNPRGSLVQGTDGNFYGMTLFGGFADSGTVFKITPSGQETILHSFGDGITANDGLWPYGSLVQCTDGNFYGMTGCGGSASGLKIGQENGCGTIFKITPSGQETIIHSFCDGTTVNDGYGPLGDLVQGKDGNLYGMTFWGGGSDDAPGGGTVFRLTLPLSTTAEVTGKAGNSPWYISDVTATLTATAGLVPVSATYYMLDGAQQTYAAPFMIIGDGVHTITYWSTDTNNSNAEVSHTQTINIDTTSPVTNDSVSGATITLNASDTVSGVAGTYYTIDGGEQQTYSSPINLSSTGTHAIAFWSVDNAGNTETTNTISVTVISSPSITNISPSSVYVNSGDFTLTINGAEFTSTSKVAFGGLSNCAHTLVSSSEITVPISNIYLNYTKTVIVKVTNTDGQTASTTFSVTNPQNPVASISGLNPESVAVNSGDFTLNINGSNFTNSTVVAFGGLSNCAHTLVSSNQITVPISNIYINYAKTVTVKVTNPAPGGGSASTTFSVVAASNPVPTITSISPDTVKVNSGDFTLTIDGTNFVSGTTVDFGGLKNLKPTLISATQLTLPISNVYLNYAKTVIVKVNNPTPGGGSASTTFTVTN